MAENTMTIVGNVTREPELRFTNSGTPVASFGVAVNRRWFNQQKNDWDEETDFIDVTCWKSLAENVAESVGKGTRVLVEGRFKQSQWEDKETGANRSKIELQANEVAPSLRWASAQVFKNERSNQQGGGQGGNQGQGQRQQQQPAFSGQPQGGQQGGQQGGYQPAFGGGGGGYDPNEEPF